MYNRKIEIALRDLEFYATLAMVWGGAGYPADDLEDIWKEVLLYQFHDIIAGSAITRVYQGVVQPGLSICFSGLLICARGSADLSVGMIHTEGLTIRP